jgi:Arc/MetJ-type ribon-helix-helix transcriptional regulator
MRDRQNTTIRLTKQERKEFEQKMETYGFSQLSPFIRFAVKQLKGNREQ